LLFPDKKIFILSWKIVWQAAQPQHTHNSATQKILVNFCLLPGFDGVECWHLIYLGRLNISNNSYFID